MTWQSANNVNTERRAILRARPMAPSSQQNATWRLILSTCTRYSFHISSKTASQTIYRETIHKLKVHFFTQQFPSLTTSFAKLFISQLAGSGSNSPKSLAKASHSAAKPMSLSDRPLGTCVVQRMNVVL